MGNNRPDTEASKDFERSFVGKAGQKILETEQNEKNFKGGFKDNLGDVTENSVS